MPLLRLIATTVVPLLALTIDGSGRAGGEEWPPAAEAVEGLLERGGGTAFVRFEHGGETRRGVVAVGAAAWPEATDSALLALGRRHAAEAAKWEAAIALLRLLEGEDVATHAWLREVEEAVGGSVVVRSEQGASTRGTVASVLRHLRVEAVREDPASRRTLVVIAVDPAAEALVAIEARGVRRCRNLAAARASAMAELRAGTLPPAGALLLRAPEGVGWLAFGSGFVRDDRVAEANGGARPAAVAAADRQARLRAEAALLAALRGEWIEASESIEEWSTFEASIDELLTTLDPGSTRHASQQRLAVVRRSGVDGRLPADLEVERIDGGEWRHAVLWWVPPDAAADGDSRAGRDARDCASEVADALASRVRVVAAAADRDRALRQALFEAVAQVNGVAVRGSRSLRHQFEDAVRDAAGSIEVAMEASTVTSDAVWTATNGLVRRYEVLSESIDRDGRVVLEICAEVPRFDPLRERPGRRETLLILPLQGRAPGGESAPGDAAREVLVERSLRRRLVERGEGRVTVLDREVLAGTDEPALGDGPPRRPGALDEALRLARRLAADLLLVGEVETFSDRRWRAFNPLREREEAHREVRIAVSVRAIDAMSGEIVSEMRFDERWGARELARQGVGETADLAESFAIEQVAEALAEPLLAAIAARAAP